MFQFKLANRILATNTYLKMINIRECDRCTFCNLEPETLAHLFWQCPKTKIFIAEMKTEILQKCYINLEIVSKTWFFPTNLSANETCLITFAKLVIYQARYNETLPTIRHLKNKIQQEVEMEASIAKARCKQDDFERRWGALKNINT